MSLIDLERPSACDKEEPIRQNSDSTAQSGKYKVCLNTMPTEVSPEPYVTDEETQGGSDNSNEEESDLPFPGFMDVAFYCLPQTHRLRLFCLKLITSPYPSLTSSHFLSLLHYALSKIVHYRALLGWKSLPCYNCGHGMWKFDLHYMAFQTVVLRFGPKVL